MNDATTTQVGGDHYRSMAIQPERFIYENGIGFHEGNAIKYLCRWRRKGGVQDLQKAKHFIDLLITHQERTEAQDRLHGILAEAAKAERRQLSKESLQAIFDSMPNGVSGLRIDWGWLTFARQIEQAHGITLCPLEKEVQP